MNGLAASLAEIVALKEKAGGATCDVVVCPPFTLIEKAAAQMNGSPFSIGAQDCHPQTTGAFTGDVSAAMLADAGARYVILGHSERRAGYTESDELIASKAAAAHAAGLTTIICVGETRHERDEGRAIEIVGAQLQGSIPTSADSSNMAIAYEPVWAIGTGLVPTIEEIAEVHAFIRRMLEERLGQHGRNVRILYGGSVKASNAAAIFSVPDVDGALVGGASLKADEFAGIIAAA